MPKLTEEQKELVKRYAILCKVEGAALGLPSLNIEEQKQEMVDIEQKLGLNNE